LFDEIADGRLHLTGVCLLAPHLTSGNVADLLAAAKNRSKSELKLLLAERFPQAESLPIVEALPAMEDQHAPAHVGPAQPSVPEGPGSRPLGRQALGPRPRSCSAPVAKGRFALHFTIGQATQDKLDHAQALLSHSTASGDLAAVFDRALDALIERLEKRRFGLNAARRSRRESSNARYIPAQIRHAVWQRDEGQCTFVSDTGHHCIERYLLELDHIIPVARGGQPTVENLRLRCRAHNQYEAERKFGVEFMRRKQDRARRSAEHRREKAEAVVPWLRALQLRLPLRVKPPNMPWPLLRMHP